MISFNKHKCSKLSQEWAFQCGVTRHDLESLSITSISLLTGRWPSSPYHYNMYAYVEAYVWFGGINGVSKSQFSVIAKLNKYPKLVQWSLVIPVTGRMMGKRCQKEKYDLSGTRWSTGIVMPPLSDMDTTWTACSSWWLHKRMWKYALIDSPHLKKYQSLLNFDFQHSFFFLFFFSWL